MNGEDFLMIFIPLGISFFTALAINCLSKNYTRLLSLCCTVSFFVIAPISIFLKATSKGGFIDLSDLYLYFGAAIVIAIFAFAHIMFGLKYWAKKQSNHDDHSR